MPAIRKLWGNTECLVRKSQVELHRIEVEPYHMCSWHKHERKWNAFLVVEGTLGIEIGDQARPSSRLLRQGDFEAVEPNKWHRFRSYDESVTAIELYYLDELDEDIVRRDVGGMWGAAVAPASGNLKDYADEAHTYEAAPGNDHRSAQDSSDGPQDQGKRGSRTDGEHSGSPWRQGSPVGQGSPMIRVAWAMPALIAKLL